MIGSNSVLQNVFDIKYGEESSSLDLKLTSNFNPSQNLKHLKEIKLLSKLCVTPILLIDVKGKENNVYLLEYTIRKKIHNWKTRIAALVDGKVFKCDAIKSFFACEYSGEIKNRRKQLVIYFGKGKEFSIKIDKLQKGRVETSIEYKGQDVTEFVYYMSLFMLMYRFKEISFDEDSNEDIVNFDVMKAYDTIKSIENKKEINLVIEKIVQCDNFISLSLIFTSGKNLVIYSYFSIYNDRYFIISCSKYAIVYDVKENKGLFIKRCLGSISKSFNGVYIYPYEINLDNGLKVSKNDFYFGCFENGESYEALACGIIFTNLILPSYMYSMQQISKKAGTKSAILQINISSLTKVEICTILEDYINKKLFYYPPAIVVSNLRW